MKQHLHLLIIDPQNDFCDLPPEYTPLDPRSGLARKPALPVTGAHADMQRLATLIERGRDGIAAISVTLDSHHRYDIAHPTFWVGADGGPVEPFTQIACEDLRAARFLPRDPKARVRAQAYLDALEANGRYQLLVWPVHCEIGSWGHNVHEDVRAAYNRWEDAALGVVTKIAKGSNPWTEHYSAVMAEVPDDADPDSQLNRKLIDSLAASHRVYIAGEAGSHCVKATTEHIVEQFDARGIALDKLVLVTDCLSPVPGFESQQQDFLDRMRARGVQLQQSADVLQEFLINAGADMNHASDTPFVPVVRSLLETDLYKFSMWQALLHWHPGAQTEYEFRCRNKTAYPLAELKDEVEHQLDHLCTMSFREEELDYLRSLRYIKSDFVDFLTVFRFQRKFITVETDGEHLAIRAVGPQVHVMGFEIFVLYIVNELYFRRFDQEAALAEGRRRLDAKIAALKDFGRQPMQRNPFEFSDFGVRRRFSSAWHDEVVRRLATEVPEFFKGTSNVYLAMRYKIHPIGTMAHEYMQSFQAFGVRLRDFQKAALEDWVQEFRGDLGVALTDVVGMDAFLRDFDLYFAKLFDGLRHDSGDPVVWGEKAIAHYNKLRIDPNTKRLVFSDGLDLDRAISLYRHFADRITTGFGIGTWLTNDLGVQPLNIVMKLVRCNGQSVAKLSDSPGKTMSKDETFLAYLRQVFEIAEPEEK